MPGLGEVALARSTSESAQTVALRADTKKPGANPGFNVWWPGAESNHRHKDFQSSALPTELPGQEAGV
jgi:hypothetical protein